MTPGWSKCGVGYSESAKGNHLDKQGGKRSKRFLKKLGCNLLFLVVLGGGLYMLFPEQMAPVFDLYGMVFGPVALVVLILAALPGRE